jgi:16S rRNA processing protein RimM
LRGAVRVEVLTDDPARFEAGARLFPEGSDEQLTVDWSQSDGPGILIRFRECPDRAAVESLRDRYLEALVSADDRPADSWYWHEVLGVTVTTSTGEELGQVSDIFRTGGSEVFVVEGPRGEVLVPAVASVFVDFAPTSGRIVVDPEALDLDDSEPRSRVRGRRTTRARRARERGEAVEAAGAGEAAGNGEATDDAAVTKEAAVAATEADEAVIVAQEADPAAT